MVYRDYDDCFVLCFATDEIVATKPKNRINFKAFALLWAEAFFRDYFDYWQARFLGFWGDVLFAFIIILVLCPLHLWRPVLYSH